MTPPPCVPILKAKLNFSLKWGMWPVAEMVPQSGQKVSPPPTRQRGVRGCWPQERFKYFTCNRRRGTSTRIPKSSELANSKFITNIFIHKSHWASPWSKCWGGIWLMSAPCHSSKPFFWVQKAERKCLKIHKINIPVPGEEWSVRTAIIPQQSMFGTSTPFMPQDSHTYTLAIILLPKWKSFQRKTLRAENFNVRYSNNARVPQPFHSPTQMKKK